MENFRVVLAKYPPEYHAAVVQPLESAGGMSGAQFWRVECRSRACILRRWPAEYPSPVRLTFIHAVLRHGAADGCNILPVPVTTRTGETFVTHAGYLWELAPWMQGAADFQKEPTSQKLRAALRALAQFHIAVRDFPADKLLVGGGRPEDAERIAPRRHLARLRELSSTTLSDLQAAVLNGTWPELAPLASKFLDTLPVALPRAIAQLEPIAKLALPMQPCLRDIWHDHVLFMGDEVTGFVDFGAIDFDTPATDIARLLGSLSDASTDSAAMWREGIEAYGTVRPLSDDEVRAAYALDQSAPILAGCNWIRWIHNEGREFDDHARIITRFRQICRKLRL